MILVNNINMDKKDSGNWKSKSQKYLKELQSFLDKADNIQDEQLKKDIIFQMLKCDNELTLLAEKMFKRCYVKGKRKIKKEQMEDD